MLSHLEKYIIGSIPHTVLKHKHHVNQQPKLKKKKLNSSITLVEKWSIFHYNSYAWKNIAIHLNTYNKKPFTWKNISKIKIQVSNWQKISAVISQIKESLFLLLKISENSRDAEENKEAKKQCLQSKDGQKTRSDIHSYIHTQKVDF